VTEERKEEYTYKKRIMASYGARELAGQWIYAAFGFSVFFFYESVIQLPTVLAALAFVIYSIWNAVNDPLVGWLLEKIHMPWEKKGYKRFPWTLIFVIPWLISYLLILGRWCARFCCNLFKVSASCVNKLLSGSISLLLFIKLTT